MSVCTKRGPKEGEKKRIENIDKRQTFMNFISENLLNLNEVEKFWMKNFFVYLSAKEGGKHCR